MVEGFSCVAARNVTAMARAATLIAKADDASMYVADDRSHVPNRISCEIYKPKLPSVQHVRSLFDSSLSPRLAFLLAAE
jgi:hypothetical protein